jgi:hypothetical protein
MKCIGRISGIINKKKRFEMADIKDLCRLEKIYHAYTAENYLDTFKLIEDYGSFVFFRDILIYLRYRVKNEHVRHVVYQDIGKIYLGIYF